MDTNKITDPLNRGMVAGLLGMPADMVNMLRNAGRSVQNLTLMAQNKPTIPMQQDPAYGQEWWGNKLAQFGYVSPNRNAMAEFAAGLLDPTGIADNLAAKAPMLAQGLFNLGDPALMTVTKGLLAKKAYDVAPDVARAAAKNLSAPATLNKPGFSGQRGAIVWHGSPHAFNAFDASKIGTGEGAQAYGHGLYLAESPQVADSYRKNLSAGFKNAGWGPEIDAAARDEFSNFIGKFQNSHRLEFQAADAAKRQFFNLSEYADDLLSRAKKTKGKMRPLLERDAQVIRQGGQEAERAYSAMTEKLGVTGNLYKVDLPDDAIARMLDWDKPLSQQSDAVKRAIGLDKNPNASIKDMTGLEFYVATGGKLGEPTSASKTAAQHLLKKGIPGIRYLDGGSRGTGAGTSNFVVFPGEEGLLKILERNGKPLK